MSLTEREYYLGFSVFPDIGPRRFQLLKGYFGSAKSAWEASESELFKINLGAKIISNFTDFRNNFSFSQFINNLQYKKIRFLTLKDENYPKLLKEIPDPPIVIYLRGNWDQTEKLNIKVGVVGTRRMTAYGKNSTQKIVSGLAQNGVTIVSGLAEGIDTIAHKTAIENNGKTIAVLGSGIDVIYPISNFDLYFQIIKKEGLIVSEYPPGFKPTKSSFPLRNRIISGLSNAVVVIEGKKTSGALITAKYALDQGKEVFAVPGPINSPTSEATTYLIKQGATIASNAGDIIEELHL